MRVGILAVVAAAGLALAGCAKPEDTIAKRCEKVIDDTTAAQCECLAENLAQELDEDELKDFAQAFAKAKSQDQLTEDLSRNQELRLVTAGKSCGWGTGRRIPQQPVF